MSPHIGPDRSDFFDLSSNYFDPSRRSLSHAETLVASSGQATSLASMSFGSSLRQKKNCTTACSAPQALGYDRTEIPQDVLTKKKDLPIAKYLPQIAQLLEKHGIVVVTSPTGSGKSTEIPRHLKNKGMRVAVTEPRIIAARALATYVSSLEGEDLGNSVGYRTAPERADSKNTRLLYCTDGLQLVRELVGNTKHRDVLIIDEFHERNLNQDVLLAWAKRERTRNPNLRIIVMSATVDADRISAYLGGAPVVRAEGRTFPVTVREAGASVEDDVEELLREGRNVLVFQPGKKEIEACINELEDRGIEAVFLPLHRELSLETQDMCFKQYAIPKCVIATNIAEASITIPDIDAVVDSEQRRLVRAIDGVQGLYTEWIALAEREQRKGRAGRTKPGIYIGHCPIEDTRRPKYPAPEISRLQLANMVLRVKANSGIDPEKLDFLDQPPREEIPDARKSLQMLGCMDQLGEVTELGRKMAALPVSVNLGRMIVEAEREGVLEQALKIAAIIEAGGIVKRGDTAWRDAFCSEEETSDAFAQLKVFNAVQDLYEEGRVEELEELGIHLKGLSRARDSLKDLKNRFPSSPAFQCRDSQIRERLVRCFVAGFKDHIYIRHGEGWVNEKNGVTRFFGGDSVVHRGSEYVVGIPWDLNDEVGGSKRNTLHLLKWVSKISRNQVPEEILKLEKDLWRSKRHAEGNRRGPRNKRRNF